MERTSSQLEGQKVSGGTADKAGYVGRLLLEQAALAWTQFKCHLRSPGAQCYAGAHSGHHHGRSCSGTSISVVPSLQGSFNQLDVQSSLFGGQASLILRIEQPHI